MKLNCSTCRYGYDIDIQAESPVYCAPQSRIREHGYCCTGFRGITGDELDCRTDACMGLPVPVTGRRTEWGECPVCGRRLPPVAVDCPEDRTTLACPRCEQSIVRNVIG